MMTLTEFIEWVKQGIEDNEYLADIFVNDAEQYAYHCGCAKAYDLVLDKLINKINFEKQGVEHEEI